MDASYNLRIGELASKVLDNLNLVSKYTHKPVSAKWMPDITISREPGSGGKIIAKKLAKKLGFEFYDKKLINDICQEMGISPKILKQIDEKPRSLVADILQGAFNPNYISDVEYVRHLKNIMLKVGKKGDVVLLGRGSSLIIPHDKALHVRVTAPMKYRVEKTRKFEKLTKTQAIERINRVSASRRLFVNQYFNSNIDDPSSYDLVINTEEFSNDKSVELIIKAFRLKFPKHKIN